MSYQNTELHQNLRFWSKCLSLAVIIIGTLVMLGWQFDIKVFKRPVPGLVAMNPLTALLFIISGLCIFFTEPTEERKRYPLLLPFLSFIVLITGVSTLGGMIFNSSFHIDTILFHSKLGQDIINNVPNSMAPNSAFNFILIGIILILLNNRKQKYQLPAQLLALTIFSLGLLSLLGYLYKVNSFYGLLRYIPMAVHSAITFLIFALAVLFLHPDKGMMRNFTGNNAGSTSARFLIPTAIIIPSVLGYLRLLGDWRGLYSKEFGVAILILCIIIIFIVLIWYNAASLNKKDALRKQAEEDLKKLNAELEQRVEERTQEIIKNEKKIWHTLDKMMEGIQIIDRDWKYIYVNRAIAEQGKYAREELIGFTMMEKYPGIEHSEMFATLKRCITEETTAFMENEFEYNDGSKGWFELSIQPVPEGLFILSIDITKRKAAESAILRMNTELEDRVRERTAQLEAVNKELESFSYSISHDLRAPLRAVNGYAKMIEEDYSDVLDPEGKRLLNVVQYNAQRMGTLIDDLLDFSRLGRKEIQKSDISMKEFILAVVTELNKTTENKAEIKTTELKNIHADYSLLHQVFFNLLSNAVKYSSKKEKPLIIISSEIKNNEVVYCISDNGVGFDMRYKHKLFGVFQRLHSSDEFEGTGVGLAIVQRIISKHGGKVWAEGKINEGASFFFSLPLNN